MDEGIFNPELYLERLEKSIKESVPAPVALIISFPSNPTAQVASIEFYEEVVKIALKYNVYILSDLSIR
jgi:alanine-synthesizing transaminase